MAQVKQESKMKPCPKCGQPMRKSSRHELCACCREGKNRAAKNARNALYRAKIKAAPGNVDGEQFGRKCHICGKPTNDYWCDACRARRMSAEGDDFTGYRIGI